MLRLTFLAYAAAVSAFHPSSMVFRSVNVRGGHTHSTGSHKTSTQIRATDTEKEQSASGIGWNSHQAIDSIPDSLVKEIDGNSGMRAQFEAMCRKAQNEICKAIEELDGEATFREDAWVRESGGGGISRVLSGGKVFEKAGVNLSVVYGSMPQEALKAATERGVDRAKGMKPGERVPFFACGLSSVMHPRNPFAPTMHFNYRYFETDGGVWWFGGGTDITPSYLNEEDMAHFHGTYKKVCDNHHPEYYPKFKKWADDYFKIPHRGETRGLGGIFFDDLNDRPAEELIEFSREALNSVVEVSFFFSFFPLLFSRFLLN